MTYKNYRAPIGSFLAASMLAAATLAPFAAQAATSSSAASGRTAAEAARMARLRDRADQEITRRIGRLTSLRERIADLKKLSADEQGGLVSDIEGQIGDLNSLKAKIGADADLQTLRADVQSIVKSYRIFMLVMPRAALMAAADRELSLADAIDAVGVKLHARVSQAGTAAANLQSALADVSEKTADARTEAHAAIAEVSGLAPDGGDQAKQQANASALKDARAKIRTAHEDLVAARKDARDVVQGLRALESPEGAAASSTMNSERSSTTGH